MLFCSLTCHLDMYYWSSRSQSRYILLMFLEHVYISYLPISTVEDLLKICWQLSPITIDFKLDCFMVTMVKAASDHSWDPLWSRRAPFLVSSLSTCTKKFTSMCLRNFLDLFVLAAWYSQLVSGELKSPIGTRAADLEIPLIPYLVPNR